MGQDIHCPAQAFTLVQSECKSLLFQTSCMLYVVPRYCTCYRELENLVLVFVIIYAFHFSHFTVFGAISDTFYGILCLGLYKFVFLRYVMHDSSISQGKGNVYSRLALARMFLNSFSVWMRHVLLH